VLFCHTDIQICSVKPIADNSNPIFNQARHVPEKIRSFYMVNDVKTFQFDRRLQKDSQDPENEFKVMATNHIK